MNNEILLEPLQKFYSNINNLKLLLIILNKKDNDILKNSTQYPKISLRLIDWFVTNYCKKNNITIEVKNNKKLIHISIYNSYKSNLKAFSKKAFDPFRRKQKIFLNFNPYFIKNKYIKINFTTKNTKKKNFIDTTIGQLNFFKWIIENNIYNYIKLNKNIIENDMINSQKENNKKKLDTKNLITKVIIDDKGNKKTITRKKRNELSKSKLNNLHFTKGTRTIYF